MRKKTSLDIALHFLKFRPRSIFEIERKLKQKKYSEKEIKKTIRILTQEGFLNDLEFSRMWIRNRNLLKPTSKRLLFLELRKLGINQEIIEKSLEEDEVSDIKKAKSILKKKKKHYNNISKEEFNKKMIGFLSRRGFGWDTIKEVLKI